MIINLGNNAGHVIKPIEKDDIDPSKPIDDIVKPSIDPPISNDDKLTYEVENKNIANISDNGTVEPNQDGTTRSCSKCK